jgi:hypothetical protein
MEGGEKAVEDKLVDASAPSLHMQGSHETIRHNPLRKNFSDYHHDFHHH